MTPTPRTDAEILRVPSCFENTYHHVVLADFARQLERDIAKLSFRLNVQREALEAADECLALIEDVGHGTMSDNVTIARGIVLAALSRNDPALRARSDS